MSVFFFPVQGLKFAKEHHANRNVPWEPEDPIPLEAMCAPNGMAQSIQLLFTETIDMPWVSCFSVGLPGLSQTVLGIVWSRPADHQFRSSFVLSYIWNPTSLFALEPPSCSHLELCLFSNKLPGYQENSGTVGKSGNWYIDFHIRWYGMTCALADRWWHLLHVRILELTLMISDGTHLGVMGLGMAWTLRWTHAEWTHLIYIILYA